jgi:hypothetical protein
MTMRRYSLPLKFTCSTLLLAFGCDPDAKSVTATAAHGDDAGDDATGSDTGGDGDGDGATSHGGETGDPEVTPACLETVTPIASTSETTPLGFPASELIGLSDGWTRSFGWLSEGPLHTEAAGTETFVDIGLSYPPGGTIRFVASEPNPDYPNDIAIECEDRLEIEFEIIFRTLDGRFDEDFYTMTTATTSDRITFRQRFAPDGFNGSFSSAETSFSEGADGTVLAFELIGTFAEDGPTGALWTEIHLDFGDPEAGIVGFGTIASWPAGPE